MLNYGSCLRYHCVDLLFELGLIFFLVFTLCARSEPLPIAGHSYGASEVATHDVFKAVKFLLFTAILVLTRTFLLAFD
jgi:hypothetical protein